MTKAEKALTSGRTTREAAERLKKIVDQREQFRKDALRFEIERDIAEAKLNAAFDRLQEAVSDAAGRLRADADEWQKALDARLAQLQRSLEEAAK